MLTYWEFSLPFYIILLFQASLRPDRRVISEFVLPNSSLSH